MQKILSVIVIAAGAAWAQGQQAHTPQSLAGVVKLNRAPASNEVLKVTLPRPVERTLSNGVKLVIVESHRVPQITFRMMIPSGSLRDPKDMPGVSDATATLIRLGTKTRSAKEIADTLADLGANVSVASGQGEASIAVSSLTENFDAALAVLTDILLNPTFPDDELTKWKTRQLAILEQAKSQPGFLANDVLSKLLYGTDARQFTHPTQASLNQITRDMIVEHYKKYYVPSGELAGISGDITAADAVTKLNKALGAWKGGPVEPVSLPAPAPIKERKTYFIPRPGSVQTLVLIANHAILRNDPDYLATLVLNRVLGAGPTSRLFRVVREEKGYTYGISSNFSATRYVNHFTTGTSVRTDVTEPALAEIMKQFTDLREHAVPADELADAKSAIIANFALGLESSAGVLARWLEQREYGLPADYWDTYTAKIMAVTAEDVERVAKKYLPVDNAQIILVGDPTITQIEKTYGPVETIKVD